ncbi:MAG: hypothetical protein WCI52_02740 [bacterium]
MNTIIEVCPVADVHTHLREGMGVSGDLIRMGLKGGADVFGAMPNTDTGLLTASQVLDYICKIKETVSSGQNARFIPFLMITENTPFKEIDACVSSGIVDAKIYPHMRTTKSENGVRQYGKILPIIKHCGKQGMKCHFHPEHPSMLFSNRDAEFAFLTLGRIFLEETNATIVWEHGTDARCIPHWKDFSESGRFYVTLTAHHLATNEDLTFGDVRSTCKPPIKTEADRVSLVDLVCEDHSWVMAGSDSAFHPKEKKYVETGCCACGAFTAPFLLPLYAHVLEKLLMAGENGIFERFINYNARILHDLPLSESVVTLAHEEWEIPTSYSVGGKKASPFWAGQKLKWKIVE